MPYNLDYYSPRMACVVLAVCLAMAGCGMGNRGPSIQGTVTLDGQPLESGSILFVPADGTPGRETGCPIVAGKYEITVYDRLAVGKNEVRISAVRKTGKMEQKPLAPQGEMIEETEEAIAPEFNSQSTLTVEIKPGSNEDAHFHVRSAQHKPRR